MTDRARALDRFRKLLGGVFPVCLAAVLFLSPFAQIAHLLFADHAHRFCTVHQQFEDVPRAGKPTGADPDVSPPSSSSSRSRAADRPAPGRRPICTAGATWSSGARSHAACAVLNQTAGREPRLVLQADRAERMVRVERLVPLSRQGFRCAPLLAAPKTSPPVLAA